MEYKLFDDYITLQALLKSTGIISSGGAAKSFLKEQEVLFNGLKEERRGKKIRLGDRISIPAMRTELVIVSPSPAEIAEHQAEAAEKKRVAQLVREMNKDLKKENGKTPEKKGKPVRFPGT